AVLVRSTLVVPAGLDRSMVFAGTRLIRARRHNDTATLMLVAKTGWSTVKAKMIQSMLFSRSSSLNVGENSLLFVSIMAAIAALGLTVSILGLIRLGLGPSTIFIRVLDLSTGLVPAALPATLSIGTIFATQRLKKLGIFCTNPPEINAASGLDLVCFDKTGT